MIETKPYGTLSDGRLIISYTIYNSKGEYAEFLNYGASLHSMYVLDRNKELGDVVLGAADVDALQGRCMEGSIFGRCAGRILFGKYELSGKEVQLECNSNGHHLHGASGNYAKKLFDSEIDEANNSIIFRYKDMGEGGYGSQVDVQVKYSFNDESNLTIEYELIPYEDTILSPTNHAYFNLSNTDIRKHFLMISADNFAVNGAYGIPEGEIASVLKTPLDFTRSRKIGDALANKAGDFFANKPPIFDDVFLLNNDGFSLVAELNCKENGRIMGIYTDMPALVLYTPFCEKSTVGKKGVKYKGYCAVCLETQFVPNAVNCHNLPKPIFRKGNPLISKTVYKFEVDTI